MTVTATRVNCQPVLNAAAYAFHSSAMPCNPLPFATALFDVVQKHGTKHIESDEAKAILWVLMNQAYGQLATIDLSDEWTRLKEAILPTKGATPWT